MPLRTASPTIILLVLALGALVATVSHGTPMWMVIGETRASRGVLLLNVVAVSGLVFLTALIVAFVVHRSRRAGHPGDSSFGDTALRGLPVTAATVAVLSLLVIAHTNQVAVEHGPGSRGPFESADRRGRPLSITGWWNSSVVANEGLDETQPGNARAMPLDVLRIVLVVIGGILLLLTAAVAWRRYSSGRADVDAPPEEDRAERRARRFRTTVAETIDAMLADPDPRTAIRGAYARLQEGLTVYGTQRRVHEGPMEHLRRVLTTLRVQPAPLRRLIELFEIARFSTHSLSTVHRERALDALRVIASDLGAGSGSSHTPSDSQPIGTVR